MSPSNSRVNRWRGAMEEEGAGEQGVPLKQGELSGNFIRAFLPETFSLAHL